MMLTAADARQRAEQLKYLENTLTLDEVDKIVRANLIAGKFTTNKDIPSEVTETLLKLGYVIAPKADGATEISW